MGMYVCVSVYTYICMYIPFLVYIYIYVYVDVDVDVDVDVCLLVCRCLYKRTCAIYLRHVCRLLASWGGPACTRARLASQLARTSVLVYLYMYMHAYVCTHTFLTYLYVFLLLVAHLQRKYEKIA